MQSRGFTLIELMVSIGIFGLMTALVIAKYGNFNQRVLLTNLAYDVALTIRTAQTYGLSVKNAQTGTNFQYAYGVDFDPSNSNACSLSNPGGSTAVSNRSQFLMYADSNSGTPNSICDSGDTLVGAYTVKRGAVISGVCAGTGCSLSGTDRLDITFKRPDPNANICSHVAGCGQQYAQIEVEAVDGSTRVVEVRDNGQISVLD